jgi:Uma2 family endonuclease
MSVPNLHPDLETSHAGVDSSIDPALDPSIPHPPTDLESDDGEPLESPWHRAAMNFLIESVTYYYRDRSDFFVGGNMFLHYSDQKVWNREFRGPDFFFVWGVDRYRNRDYYATWLEGGHMPNVIIELSSPSTARVDRVVKLDLYQNILRTPEYFIFDPETNRLDGYRLLDGRYVPLEAKEQGRLWSKELALWLGAWSGPFQGVVATWPRFFQPEGQLVLLEGEAEFQRAEQERQRAEEERTRADAERRRAEAAELENARLRRELEMLRGGTQPKS